MVFDIVEKDFVSIAGLHEVFSGINVVEHDLGSAAKGCASTPVVMSVDLMISLRPYYLPLTPSSSPRVLIHPLTSSSILQRMSTYHFWLILCVEYR
jgi:hypothetical protein